MHEASLQLCRGCSYHIELRYVSTLISDPVTIIPMSCDNLDNKNVPLRYHLSLTQPLLLGTPSLLSRNYVSRDRESSASAGSSESYAIKANSRRKHKRLNMTKYRTQKPRYVTHVVVLGRNRPNKESSLPNLSTGTNWPRQRLEKTAKIEHNTERSQSEPG